MPSSNAAHRCYKRSSAACDRCHERKVRCDATIRGSPCTNCELDERQCAFRVAAKRGRKKRNHTRSPRPPHSIPATEAAPALQTPQSTIAAGDSVCPTPKETAVPQFYSAAPDEPAVGLSIGPSEEYPTRPDTNVMFCYYQFLKLDGLHKLSPRDARQLELNGSLHVPSGAILEELVRQYFLHVHPCVPMLDEGKFWSLFLGEADCVGKEHAISLFVFHAMLFVASAYVSTETIKAGGFQSIRSARRAFHRRARSLLKAQVELDEFALAQGSLLLSFQYSMIDHYTNSSFLAKAIRHAKNADAHLYDTEPTLTEDQRQQRKRLWWCCILRDRIVALGVRRSIQITPNDFDFGQECLTAADFSEEMDKSRVYRADTKRLLVDIVALQCQLAVAVTPLAMASYPARDSSSQNMSLISQFIQAMARVEECKTELAVWARRSRTILTNRDSRDIPLSPVGVSDTQESVMLYIDMTHMYYLSARIALCHYSTSVLQMYKMFIDDYEPRLDDVKRDLEASTVRMADTVQSLIERGVARYLPLSMTTYIAMPFVLQCLDTKLSSASQSPLCERRMAVYNELMQSLGLRYEAMEVVSAAVKKLLDFADTELPMLPTSPESNDRQPVPCGITEGIPSFKSWGQVILQHPKFYLRLSLSLDYCVSRGSYPSDHELPGWVLGPYLQEPLCTWSPANSLTLLRPSSPFTQIMSPGRNEDQCNEQNTNRQEPNWSIDIEAIPRPGSECAPKDNEDGHDSIMDGLLDEMLLYGGFEDIGVLASSFPQPIEDENQAGMFCYS